MQAEDSADGFAAAWSGAFAAFSGTCQGQAGVLGLSIWACAAADDVIATALGSKRHLTALKKAGVAFVELKTALAADWRAGVASDS